MEYKLSKTLRSEHAVQIDGQEISQSGHVCFLQSIIHLDVEIEEVVVCRIKAE